MVKAITDLSSFTTQNGVIIRKTAEYVGGHGFKTQPDANSSS
jgi:hypothetical protein